MMQVHAGSSAKGGLVVRMAFGEKPGKGKFRLNSVPDGFELVLGMGSAEKLKMDDFRKSAGRAFGHAKSLEKESFSLILPSLTGFKPTEVAQAIAEGLWLVSYQFDRYKSKNDSIVPKTVFLVGDEKMLSPVLSRVALVQKNVRLVRDLVNENSVIVTPKYLAQTAKKLAAENKKLKVSVLDSTKMKKLGMNLLLAVGQAGTTPPEMISVEYAGNPSSKEKILLVGKGVTFDSGGLDIKTQGNMLEMRTDMTGSATMLATIKAAAELGLKKNIVAVLACVENLVDAKSYRPGEIIRSYSGKSVEVMNTDAEGRLVLADALSYFIEQVKPKMVVDYATLTGACAATFGPYVAGMVSNHEGMAAKFLDASAETYERVCRLPLYEEYVEDMKSSRADLRSLSKSGKAGTITAAAFLSEFVGDTPWVHLDIAGTAYYSKPEGYYGEGATGFGVRLLLAFLEKV